MSTITIIVTTFNRCGPLADSLRGLLSIDRPKGHSVEILVVDNASTDDTRKVTQHFIDDDSKPEGFLVRYTHEPAQGVPFARVRGVQEAYGQWIAFFDDDQLPERNWLTTLLDAAEHWKVKCVGGSRPLRLAGGYDVDKLPAYCRKLLGEQIRTETGAQFHKHFLPTTGNALVHRSVFEDAGTFRTEFVESGEDTEFFLRILSSGIEARYQPEAIVYHLIPGERLNDEYYLRTARRHGIILARCESIFRGRYGVLAQSIARAMHGIGIILPRLSVAKLLRQKDATIEYRCRWIRVRGYLQFAASYLFSSRVRTPLVPHRIETRSPKLSETSQCES